MVAKKAGNLLNGDVFSQSILKKCSKSGIEVLNFV